MLFLEELSPRSITILASFFFGNWITLNVAAPFYALCIGHIHFYIQNMTVLYLKWQNDFYNCHQAIYYDVTMERLMYINGSVCHKHREPLTFDLGGMQIPIGFAGPH
jgi:hypothetical protein